MKNLLNRVLSHGWTSSAGILLGIFSAVLLLLNKIDWTAFSGFMVFVVPLLAAKDK